MYLFLKYFFRRNFDGMLLRCIDSMKFQMVLTRFHEGICRGHFAPATTTHRIMRVGYYWPTIFKDSYAMIRNYISCPIFYGKMKGAAMSLLSITIEGPFVQWGLDFIGPINPKSSKGHSYILAAIDYFTMWQEVVALKKVDFES